MRKQFEDRARLVIYLDRTDLNALTTRAKLEGRVLIAWAREVLMREIELPRVTHKTWPFENCKDVAGLSPAVGNHTPTPEVREASGNNSVHTAKSNRLTCMCASCSDYRRRNDIPLGGFPKRAKK